VISTKRFSMLLAAAVVVTLGSSVPGWAQVMVPMRPYRYVRADSSVRIEVTPKEAEVYVDGYYAGIVDDFDGVFQRLHTEPGQHEIALYLKGYRTARQQVYLTPDNTFTIKLRLEPLTAGDVAEARPTPPPPPAVAEHPQGAPLPQGPWPGDPRPRRGRGGFPPAANMPPPNEAPAGGQPAGQAGAGTLTIQLQPVDADVVIDGQPWPASQASRFVVDVTEGRHIVQVRKTGYVGYLTEVEVRRGETTTLNVSLRPQP
jgi:hypothetical protein